LPAVNMLTLESAEYVKNRRIIKDTEFDENVAFRITIWHLVY
jgi:hypothetical protein